jgi:pyridoxal phosphate enzyme (YggS family)
MKDRLLFNNIKGLYRRISHAAMRAGREPHEVALIAVTKTVDSEAVISAVEAGLRDFGESRVQEASEKIADLKFRMPDSKIRWHLIGHLQKNKAKMAVELFDVVHSVDSIELAEALDRHAEKAGKRLTIFIQVKLSDEESKYGIFKENIASYIEKISQLKNLCLEGLMTIPPFFEDPEMARPYFRELREIRDSAGSGGFRLKELSMGMSNDFEVAIEEGATMVRVGTAIFGERKKEAV